MLGAIVGDVIGSVYEFAQVKNMDFKLFSEDSHFTGDTVLTIAIADAILCYNIPEVDQYREKLLEWGHLYPNGGYGTTFQDWLLCASPAPYNSFCNGSAMRVSAIGHAFNDLPSVLQAAEKSALPTHNHPEGIKGAQATAAAIFLARTSHSKPEIKEYIESTFHYDLSRCLDEIRFDYVFDESCQKSVPESIISFLESENYEDAVRKAVSLGGDADTLASIAGSIASAYYQEIPTAIIQQTRELLDVKMLDVIDRFEEKYKVITTP